MVAEYCKNDVLSTQALFEDFASQGVFEVAAALHKAFPFVQDNPFYTAQSVLGADILSTLYRQAVGLTRGKKLEKPARVPFAPKDVIHPSVQFADERNRQALEYLKGLPADNVVDLKRVGSRLINAGCTAWGDRHLKDLRFFAGTVPIRLGVGGIHTDCHQQAFKGHLIEFDVTSYYPSLIRQADRNPI